MSSEFFVAGGALAPDAPSYIKRPADTILYSLIAESRPGYVVAPSQMGKTSLMIHTAGQLASQQQASIAMIYLSGLSSDLELEAWYLGLVTRLNFLLNLTVDTETWWEARTSLIPPERFIQFLREKVLAETSGTVVLFFDEIEVLSGLKGAADFLSTLRLIYETRTVEPAFQRLNFFLLGTAIPADLINKPQHSPFAIAQKIDLTDFSREELKLLQAGLEDIDPRQAQTILNRIYYWTSGQPYLTQKLGLVVAELIDYGQEQQAENGIDQLVEKLFLSSANEDLNLFSIREGVINHPQRRQLLALYRRIYEGQISAKNEQSLDQQRLKLLGLIREENGGLKVRNLIYRQVFNLNWLKSNSTSIKPTRYLMIGLILSALVITGILGMAVYNRFEQVIAAQAQPFLDNFNSTSNPDVRLTSLAGLFKVSGYQDEARQSFFEQLSPQEQVDLFAQQTNAKAVGVDLVTVIQGIYTAPNLENNEQNNALLLAMAKPLKQLVDEPSTPQAVSLELEITQWVNGRKAYNVGEYQQAVSDFQRAIELNDQNPGVFFDRSLAYAALGEAGLALADLSAALMLDETWQLPVEQALISNSQLYNALWTEADTSDTLIALVPSPTSTPVPTDTPTPSPTPKSTATPTPRLPTATPTVTVTPTPASVTLSTPTPLPDASVVSNSAVPAGTFTLLAPLSPAEPSYGLTQFVWQWSGPLPPEYGFEVRVWREGQPQTGVHNAVLDNQNGNIKGLGNNQYELNVNIKDAAGVQNNSGEYLWTVALVRISPKYRDVGQQAPPGRFLFAAPGGSGGGDKGDGGGGVGIE